MAPFAMSRQACFTCKRAFSTSSTLAWKSNKNALKERHENLPEYPFGPALWYKQSNRGLYGGSRLQFGNNISERTETKSRREWHPNIKNKLIFSKALNKNIKVRVSTRVMRTIDKVGGLDEYLLGEKTARIRELGMEGWRLRCMVMATDKVQKRLNQRRIELGLQPVDYRAMLQEVLSPPPEALETPYEDEDGSGFEVDEAELESIAQEDYLAEQANEDQAHQLSKESLFIVNAEKTRS